MSIPAAQTNFIYRKEEDNSFKKDETCLERERRTNEATSKTQLARINSSICKPFL